MVLMTKTGLIGSESNDDDTVATPSEPETPTVTTQSNCVSERMNYLDWDITFTHTFSNNYNIYRFVIPFSMSALKFFHVTFSYSSYTFSFAYCNDDSIIKWMGLAFSSVVYNQYSTITYGTNSTTLEVKSGDISTHGSDLSLSLKSQYAQLLMFYETES
jgi:hypothetical protein